MKLAIATVAAALTIGTMASAQATTFSEADRDGNGQVDFSEAQMIYPTLDEVQFNTFDGDTNQVLDESEFDAMVVQMETNNTAVEER